MTDTKIMNFIDNAKDITFEDLPDGVKCKGLEELEGATTVSGYDQNGELSFFAVFDEADNWRLDLYEKPFYHQFLITI